MICLNKKQTDDLFISLIGGSDGPRSSLKERDFRSRMIMVRQCAKPKLQDLREVAGPAGKEKSIEKKRKGRV